MVKQFEVFYNDGVYYGTFVFHNKSKSEIDNFIQGEIKRNNKNINKDYHITKDNFQEVI